MRTFFSTYPLSVLCFAAILWLSLTTWFPEMPDLQQVPFYDKWAHFVMYGGWTSVIWTEYFRSGRHSIQKAMPGAVLFPAATGGLLELAQAYLTTCRSGDWIDFLANCVGVAIGMLLGMAWYRIRIK